jgi:ATP phosphoribosyltransferase
MFEATNQPTTIRGSNIGVSVFQSVLVRQGLYGAFDYGWNYIGRIYAEAHVSHFLFVGRQGSCYHRARCWACDPVSTTVTMSAERANCRFAIPKKGRLYEKVSELLRGAGISFRREDRLDVAECTDFPLTLVFLPAADIAKYVGQGNVDLGITGLDVVEESNVEVEKVMDLGFGACKLCVQAPSASQITDVQMLAGKRIVTSFPHLTKKFFDLLDAKNVGGTPTSINFVSGSVEVACGLGLADAVVDLVETGTTMKVSWRARPSR